MTKAGARKRDKNASATRVVGRPFAKGNPGRPKGAKNKVRVVQIADAREHFADLVAPARTIIENHLKFHEEGTEDCSSCRHYIDVVHAYYFGKPTQTLDIDPSALREQIEESNTASPEPTDERNRLSYWIPFLYRDAPSEALLVLPSDGATFGKP